MTEQDTPLWSDNPTSSDLLGFSDIADSLIDALKREKLDPLALGVFGDRGSGKTSILEITRATLAAEEKVIVIFTHPWEYDPKTDPKATLISEVLTAIEERAKAQEGWTEKLGEGFKALKDRVNWSKAVSLVANTAVTLSIPSIDKIVDVFSKEGSEAEPTLQGFREEFAKLMGDLSGIDRVVDVA
jgi:KAP family P-loop domain